MHKNRFYHRKAMAQNYARRIMEDPIHPGLFLAAPRRTGKTTFMREDLAPALTEAGAEVIYVDLWSNKQADPADLINQAVHGAIDRNLGLIAKLTKQSGITKLSVGGVEIDTQSIGKAGGATLASALAALSDSLQKPIALIIDEAQHAVTTGAGSNTLFALKAARDELNSSQHHGLRLICTGSSRDKLAMLRNSRDQAFFNAPLVNFPHLDKGYVEWFCHTSTLAFPLDQDRVWQAFLEAGYRPEALQAARKVIEYSMISDPDEGNAAFSQAVAEHIQEMNEATLSVVRSLTPIQSAVLKVMAEEGKSYAPFEVATMPKYAQMLQAAGMSEEDAKAAAYPQNVQQALAALQEKSLVWKADRGVYAIEEQALPDLMRQAGMLPGADDTLDPTYEPH
jgi:hypothetical protein